MHYKSSKVSKRLALILLLSASLFLLQSASAQQEQEAFSSSSSQDVEEHEEDEFHGCATFPCPVPDYPPGNTCILAHNNNTFMLTYNLPRLPRSPPYTEAHAQAQAACQKIIPWGRPDIGGCNSVSCYMGNVISTLVLCNTYNQEECFKNFEDRDMVRVGGEGGGKGRRWEEEVFKCGGRGGDQMVEDGKLVEGRWRDNSLCVCSPCGVAFMPVPLLVGDALVEAEAWEGKEKDEKEEKDGGGGVGIEAENQDVSVMVL